MASSNMFVVGLALCTCKATIIYLIVGNISSAEMARDLSPDLEGLMGNSNTYIRKKAVLCALRYDKHSCQCY